MVVRRLLHESPPLVRLALTTVRLRAADVKIIRGASPLGLPDCLSRSPLRRLAPFGRLASLRSLAVVGREERRVRVAALGSRALATRLSKSLTGDQDNRRPGDSPD